jgi:methylase of polypeptide subunit release factors
LPDEGGNLRHHHAVGREVQIAMDRADTEALAGCLILTAMGPISSSTASPSGRSSRTAIDYVAPLGAVVEIAGGTGNWTIELAQLTDSMTVVDASPQAVAIAQGRSGARGGG